MVARKRPHPTQLMARSAVSNGSHLFRDVDGRSGWMRRLRDLIADHVSDLGGQDALSTAEMALVRRASMLCLQCEMMEASWAENEGVAGTRQIDNYQKCVGALRRTLQTLGLKRRPRDVTPPAPLEYARRYSGNGHASR